jgi:hypothetical protein
MVVAPGCYTGASIDPTTFGGTIGDATDPGTSSANTDDGTSQATAESNGPGDSSTGDGSGDASSGGEPAGPPDPTHPLFRTGFEPSEPQPTWTSTTASSTAIGGAGGSAAPECAVLDDWKHANNGSHALTFAGHDASVSASSVAFQVFDVDLTVGPHTRLAYALHPDDALAIHTVVDLEFTDGTTLQDSGRQDTRGCSVHPSAGHCGEASPGAWLSVEVDLGELQGKSIDRILVAYDHAAEVGDFRGTVDEIVIGDSLAQCEDATPIMMPVATNRVVPIYLVAPDTPAADAEAHAAALESAMSAAQAWYAEQMDPSYPARSFRYDPVQVLPSNYTRAEWTAFGTSGFAFPNGTHSDENGGCGMWEAAQFELRDNGLLEQAGLPPLGSPGVLYYALGGGGTNGSCGAAGYLAAGELNLIELTARYCPSSRFDACATDCRWTGAIAHELGHGFGLPHGVDWPEPCPNSLMDQWWLFDQGVSLCDLERDALAESDYFGPFTP